MMGASCSQVREPQRFGNLPPTVDEFVDLAGPALPPLDPASGAERAVRATGMVGERVGAYAFRLIPTAKGSPGVLVANGTDWELPLRRGDRVEVLGYLSDFKKRGYDLSGLAGAHSLREPLVLAQEIRGFWRRKRPVPLPLTPVGQGLVLSSTQATGSEGMVQAELEPRRSVVPGCDIEVNLVSHGAVGNPCMTTAAFVQQLKLSDYALARLRVFMQRGEVAH